MIFNIFFFEFSLEKTPPRNGEGKEKLGSFCHIYFSDYRNCGEYEMEVAIFGVGLLQDILLR